MGALEAFLDRQFGSERLYFWRAVRRHHLHPYISANFDLTLTYVDSAHHRQSHRCRNASPVKRAVCNGN